MVAEKTRRALERRAGTATGKATPGSCARAPFSSSRRVLRGLRTSLTAYERSLTSKRAGASLVSEGRAPFVNVEV